MPHLDRGPELQGAAALGAAVALDRLAQVGEPRLEVAARLDAAQMPAVAVGAGDELPSRSVSSAITSPSNPTGPSEPPEAPNAARISSSVEGREPPPQRVEQLRLAEPVVAADEREHERPVVLDDRHRLRRRRGVDPEKLRERLDRRHAGVSTSSGAPSGSGNSGARGIAARDLEVGGVVAVLAA